LIGPIESSESILAATGPAMLVLTLAVITVRSFAKVIAGVPPSVDLRPLVPTRFDVRAMLGKAL
jgi:hypothetical protein